MGLGLHAGPSQHTFSAVSPTLSQPFVGVTTRSVVSNHVTLQRLSLPAVVFVIENNHYGMGTSVARATRAPALYKRGDFLPGFRVDGMDVVAVKQATEYAKSYALQHGPLLVEMETYRYHGHSMSDPGSSYRTRDEVQEVRRKRDPLAHLKSVMLEHGAATEDEIKAIDKEAKKTVSDVVESCKQEREPGVKEYMAKYAYVNPSPFGRGARGVTIDKEWKYATG